MAKSHSEWIDVDPSRFNRVDRTVDNGVEITVGMSPNDLPDGVRGHYSNDEDLFVIQFRYLSDSEQRMRESLSDHVAFVVGKRSRRLYEIRVDVRSLGVESVELKVVIPKEIEKAFESFTRSRQNDSRMRNYMAAGEVLEARCDELLQGV